MPLQQGVVESYDSDRMIVHFTMLDQDKVILCAVTTGAMDEIEGSRNVGAIPAHRSVHEAACEN